MNDCSSTECSICFELPPGGGNYLLNDYCANEQCAKTHPICTRCRANLRNRRCPFCKRDMPCSEPIVGEEFNARADEQEQNLTPADLDYICAQIEFFASSAFFRNPSTQSIRFRFEPSNDRGSVLLYLDLD